MDNREAREILRRQLESYRARSYVELVNCIDAEADVIESVGTSGANYQTEIRVLWDDRAGGDVRVLGCIDDGRWRAFVPLGESFIKSPDGSFVGE